VEPLFLFKAFLDGMDGVIKAGCHPMDCHHHRGNYFARRRMVMVQDILKDLNLEAERVRLSRATASECGRFQQLIEDFDEERRN